MTEIEVSNSRTQPYRVQIEFLYFPSAGLSQAASHSQPRQGLQCRLPGPSDMNGEPQRMHSRVLFCAAAEASTFFRSTESRPWTELADLPSLLPICSRVKYCLRSSASVASSVADHGRCPDAVILR